MSNRVQDLIRILPPPSKPTYVPSRYRFNEIETRINLTLPDDFKEILFAYGGGRWQCFYFLMNPLVDSCIDDWTSPEDDKSTCHELSLMRFCRDQDKIHDSDDVPYAIFPEEGGLFPWAQTENGGCMFWITAGSRSHWRSVYYSDRRRWSHEEFDLSCSELLCASVSGELPVFDPNPDNHRLPNVTNSTLDRVYEPAAVT